MACARNVDMADEGEIIAAFDYDAPAELFLAQRKGGARPPLSYGRCARAAEARRFAMEDNPAVRALGAWMQVGDDRFDGEDIPRLYDGSDYPLRRRPAPRSAR